MGILLRAAIRPYRCRAWQRRRDGGSCFGTVVAGLATAIGTGDGAAKIRLPGADGAGTDPPDEFVDDDWGSLAAKREPPTARRPRLFPAGTALLSRRGLRAETAKVSGREAREAWTASRGIRRSTKAFISRF